MVTLYVAGQPVGTWAESEQRVAELAAQNLEIELRDETGKVIGRVIPPEPIIPWHPEMTREDIDRMIAQGGGVPLAEFWKRMGVE
ncbi:MAG TPA: hypothetical protein VFG68_17980 [Fimbriiglobus sp.]|nr:hypothetical protein [Fimbriiglobus sp.]